MVELLTVVAVTGMLAVMTPNLTGAVGAPPMRQAQQG